VTAAWLGLAYPENPSKREGGKPAEINAPHLPILLSNKQLIFGYTALYSALTAIGGHHAEAGSDLRSRQY
jgi:hypothetical protein